MATVVRRGDLSRTLDKRARELARRCAKGTVAAAGKLLEMSTAIAPVETEALKQSAHVLDNGGQGFDKVAAVGYGRQGFLWAGYSHQGRFETRHPHDYALIVHEIALVRPQAPYTGFTNYLRDPCLTGIPQMREAFNREVL